MNKLQQYIAIGAAAVLVACGAIAACKSCSHSDDSEPVAELPHPDLAPVKLHVSKRVGNLARQFNDLQDSHLEVATRVGIKPIESLHDIWMERTPVVRIHTCDDFVLDDLTHSHPYLTAGAAELLHDLGRRFNDSLAVRGGGNYHIKLTSALRTEESVKRLSRRNINAVKQSTHLFGTTFDISYAKFPCDSVTVPRTDGDLKNLLAEILLDLRDEGRCLVKYERKQGCFHITSTR